MAKFIYKFESIKRIKKLLEKKAQKELMLIQAEINKKNNEIAELEKRKKDQREETYSKKNIKVTELKFQEDYEKYIDERIAQISSEIDILEKEKEEKLKDLTEKSKEHKTFEKLKEKYKTEFEIEEKRKDQLNLDEIASIRHKRSS